MKQLEQVDPARFLELADDIEDLRRRKPEFCGLTTGFLPFTRSFRIKLYADTNHRKGGIGILCRNFGNEIQSVFKIGHRLGHDDDSFSGAGACECKFHEIAILESIKDE